MEQNSSHAVQFDLYFFTCSDCRLTHFVCMCNVIAVSLPMVYLGHAFESHFVAIHLCVATHWATTLQPCRWIVSFMS
jgi:hypothetical protein